MKFGFHLKCWKVYLTINDHVCTYSVHNYIEELVFDHPSSVFSKLVISTYIQGFWYFAEKKAKFRRIFKGKFAEKSANFAGFSREKSQNSQKNRPISRDFSRKKSKFEAFSGANSQKNRPISREILTSPRKNR